MRWHFSASFSKGNDNFDFQFASIEDKSLPEKRLIPIGINSKFATAGEVFNHQELTTIETRDKNENDRVGSSEYVTSYL